MPGRIRLLAVGAVALLLVGWWAFPSLARDAERLDVLIVGDGQVADASEPLQRRVRELGMSVELQLLDPCASASQIVAEAERLDPSIVVVASATPTACGGPWWEELRGELDGVRLIALLQPGHNDPGTGPAIDAAGVEVADATRMLGAQAVGAPVPTRIGCQWWDDCEADGQVTIRDDAGALTPAGGERLARTLAGIIP